MSELFLRIHDEYNNLEGWHKMTLRLRPTVGEHSYRDMELLYSEGDSVFLRELDMKKLIINEVADDRVVLTVSYLYNQSEKDELRTVTLTEPVEAVFEERAGESLEGLDRVIEYDLRYAIRLTLERE